MITKPSVNDDLCVSIPKAFYLLWVNACIAQCLNSVLNVKALVGTFNQEKALVGAFSMIVKTLPINRLHHQ